MPRIAFFDLDRTLVDCNSGSVWVSREVRLGHITRWQQLRAFFWFARYSLGGAGLENVIEAAIASYAGTSESDVRERTRAMWRDEVRARIRPGARGALDRHRARGDRLVLLTTSSNYLAEAVTEDLGLDEFLCNRFETSAGVFTGHTVQPLCYGEGKRSHAEDAARRHGVTLDSCAFYTDSYSDVPVLEVVGEPVAVHPDPRLARLARKRGWRTERW